MRPLPLALLVAFAMIMVPAIAAACPVCGVDNSTTTLKVVAVFLTVPFFIGAVVLRVIRRLDREDPIV